MISLLGNKPTEWSGPEPDADPPFPLRSSSQQNGSSSPPWNPPCNRTPPPPARNHRPDTTPPPPPGRAGSSASENSRFGNSGNSGNYEYDVNRAGHTKRYSLGILEWTLAATERDIKVQYRRLAHIYHPDKYNPTNRPMMQFEAQEHFKVVNNAYEFLRT